MGVASLKKVSANFKTNCEPPADSTQVTYTHPFQSTTATKSPPFTIVKLRKDMNHEIYQAAIADITFSIKASICPCEHGQMSLVHNQQVFGAVRGIGGEIYFKRRIPLSNGCTLIHALEQFCHKKLMALLEVGENIGQLFGSDCEIYPTFLQYCSQMPITQYKGIGNKELQKQTEANHLTLKRHHLKYEIEEDKPDLKYIAYSASFRKFVFLNGCLTTFEQDPWELLQQKKNLAGDEDRNNSGPNSSSGLLSVESNVEKQVNKLLRNHDSSLKQVIKLQDARNSLDQQMNRLENTIYMGNRHVESLIREKIEKELLDRFYRHDLQVSTKYYMCLEHFLQRANRLNEASAIIRQLLQIITNRQLRAIYSRRLAILLNDESPISKFLRENTLSNESAIWLSSLSRAYFDREQDIEALKALQKSCAMESELQNGAYLSASEILFQNGMISLAKDYLREGVRKGYRINGPCYINNSKLYNNLGLILVHEGNLAKSLDAFEQARKPYEMQRMCDPHYFEILSNEFCVMDRMFEFDRGYLLFKEEVEKRIADIKRKQSPNQFIRLLSNVGCFLFNSSHYPEARAVLGLCLKYPAAWNALDNDSYVRLFTNLACLELKQKEPKTEAYFKYALERESESFKVRTDLVTHWTSYHLHNNLALFYYRKGELRRSIAEFEEVQDSLGSMQEAESVTDPSLLHLNYNIACVYRKALKTDKAMEYLEEADRLATKLYSSDHPFARTIAKDLQDMNKQRIMELSAEHEAESITNHSVLRPRAFGAHHDFCS